MDIKFPFDPDLEEKPLKKRPISEYTKPPEEDTSYIPPPPKKGILDTLDSNSLSDPSVREQLENLMVRSLFNMLEDKETSGNVKLGAVKEIKEILGLDRQIPVQDRNVQINQYGVLNPEKAKHLLQSLKGASAISESTDSGVKPRNGGQGI